MAQWSKDPVVKARQKAARKEAYKRRRQNDPVFRRRESKREGLRANHGITLADYERLQEIQDNRCGICGKQPQPGDRDLAVDHNHATGYIRGLLCFHCNVGIGHLQDDVAIVLKAAAWLAAHS